MSKDQARAAPRHLPYCGKRVRLMTDLFVRCQKSGDVDECARLVTNHYGAEGLLYPRTRLDSSTLASDSEGVVFWRNVATVIGGGRRGNRRQKAMLARRWAERMICRLTRFILSRWFFYSVAALLALLGLLVEDAHEWFFGLAGVTVICAIIDNKFAVLGVGGHNAELRSDKRIED